MCDSFGFVLSSTYIRIYIANAVGCRKTIPGKNMSRLNFSMTVSHPLQNLKLGWKKPKVMPVMIVLPAYMLRQKQRNVTPRVQKQVMNVVYTLYDSKGNIVDKLIVIVNGDVNGDGKVNAADYIAQRRHILGIIRLDTPYFTAADVNGNGKVQANDYIKLRKFLLGFINTLD